MGLRRAEITASHNRFRGASPGSYSLPKSNKRCCLCRYQSSQRSFRFILMTTALAVRKPITAMMKNMGERKREYFLTFHGMYLIGGVTNMSQGSADKNTAIDNRNTCLQNDRRRRNLGAFKCGHNDGWRQREVSFIHSDKQDPDKMWTFHYDFGTVVTTNNWDIAERLDGVRFLPFMGVASGWRHSVAFVRIFAVGNLLQSCLCRKIQAGLR